jgi:hypothetical protein
MARVDVVLEPKGNNGGRVTPAHQEYASRRKPATPTCCTAHDEYIWRPMIVDDPDWREKMAFRRAQHRSTCLHKILHFALTCNDYELFR